MPAPSVAGHGSESCWSRDGHRPSPGLVSRGLARRVLLAALTLALLFAFGGAASALASTDPVFDNSISDPANLSGATAVDVSGNYAYTTAYGAGQLTAVDVSNPADPIVAGESAQTNELFNGSGITIAGGYAYVVSKNRNGPNPPGTSNDDGTGNSLTVLDIHTNPASPQEVGHVHDASNLFGAYGIGVSGTHAFVAAQGCLSGQPCPNSSVGNSFAVLDVSDPANPALVPGGVLHNNSLPGTWHGTDALDHADSVAISGNLAYVTAFLGNRLTVIDISDPAHPTIIASLLDPALTLPNDVAVEGNYAFVADQNSVGSGLAEFTVVDISSPSAPKVVASLVAPSLGGAYRIKVSGDFAYVSASSAAAMNVINIADPTHPALVWSDTDDTHFWHTTGVSLDSTGQFLVASSPLQQNQTNQIFPPFTTTTGTVSTIALEPTPITIAITPSSEPPATGASSTADFQFVAGNTVEAVQCQLDGQGFAPCTTQGSQQYAGLSNGSHTFIVEGIDSAGNTVTDSYTWTVGPGGPATSAPANTQVPTVSGSPVEGQTLTTGGGTWSGSPAPALAYQWQRCTSLGTGCVPIAGATGSSYTLVGDDVHSTITVVVTATNSAGSAVASSSATAVVSSSELSGTGVTGPTGTTGTGNGTPTTGTGSGKPKIKKLAVAHSHGAYALRLTLSGAATVKVTVRRTAPGRRAVVETLSKKERRGSSTISLKLHASTAGAGATRYMATVTAPGGTKHVSFAVRR